MIAVDAGTHLSSIVRILQQHMPLYSKDIPPQGYCKVLEEGPFAGIRCPGLSARANALYIFREIMHAFLITHPHLDHLSAMGINTPALEYGREAKAIVALDSTIEAIKAHIFNDSIWPNLSDEGSGVGFVTYRRLKDGGNHRLGSGDARGYVRVCESLATLCMGVTHGKCKAKPVSPHRSESSGWHDTYSYPSQMRRLSRISNDHESYFAAVQSHGHNPSLAGSNFYMSPGQATPGFTAVHTPTMTAHDLDHAFDPVKSSAFFILNEETGAEILVFGDIEPDAVSTSPQNYKVWRTAAPKVANGNLKAMFIECSYDDSVRDSDLYGHLCPRHMMNELLFLAREVADVKAAKGANTPIPSTETKRPAEFTLPAEGPRKRKKTNGDIVESTEAEGSVPPSDSPSMASANSSYVGTRSATANRRRTTPSRAAAAPRDISPISLRSQSPSRISSKHVHFTGSDVNPQTPAQGVLSPSSAAPLNYPVGSGVHDMLPRPTADTGNGTSQTPPDPLKGLTVHIIHVKDTLTDGPSPGEIILGQLTASAAQVGLECDFDITDFGESIWI